MISGLSAYSAYNKGKSRMASFQSREGIIMNRTKEALDAYSLVVIGAAESVGPTVVRISTGSRYHDREGLGSGFIFQADGAILTNAHVIAHASHVTVTLADGRKTIATLLASDEHADLAILRIPSDRPLAVAELSNDPLLAGQLVVAIGNPFGLGWSVTAGVVSALGRAMTSPDTGVMRNLIQTQAPINPGSSGGPLVNGAGQVVGITTAIVPNAQGIGFAIPVDSIYAFLKRWQRGPAPGASMGISVYNIPLDPMLVQALRLNQQIGVTIIEVSAGGPAEQGGLRKNDIIIAADQTPVQDARELKTIMERHQPGDQITLTFIRDNRQRQVTLSL